MNLKVRKFERLQRICLIFSQKLAGTEQNWQSKLIINYFPAMMKSLKRLLQKLLYIKFKLAISKLVKLLKLIQLVSHFSIKTNGLHFYLQIGSKAEVHGLLCKPITGSSFSPWYFSILNDFKPKVVGLHVMNSVIFSARWCMQIHATLPNFKFG